MAQTLTAFDRRVLAPAMGSDARQITAEVEAGVSRLIRYADGSRIVCRLERDINSAELVVVAGAGRDAWGKMAEIAALANQKGWSVRFHTRRPGLGRMLARLGFVESERVFTYGG